MSSEVRDLGSNHSLPLMGCVIFHFLPQFLHLRKEDNRELPLNVGTRKSQIIAVLTYGVFLPMSEIQVANLSFVIGIKKPLMGNNLEFMQFNFGLV